ncbi:glycosyltransferase [Marinobacter sp. CHS3-4]|uniref:glycosyltransferase n=1 Tax=Marinobacter sp. CHS3-4 TaxID=3045174 RepID=UPI0024B5ECE2|nr:glycosyltransferase [Marinobacter sp. CHS3-4]MDI9244993.1 glycosyltransferase [Marinobacter sp. CHS3-4]
MGKRFAFVTNRISHPGGAEKSIHELAVSLVDKGHSVVLISIYSRDFEVDDSYISALMSAGVEVRFAGVSRSLRLILFPLVLLRIIRYLSSQDYVECSLLMPSIYLLMCNFVMKRKILFGIRMVYRKKYENKFSHLIYKILVRWHISRDRLVVYAISNFAANKFLDYIGIYRTSISIVYNSVNVPETCSGRNDLIQLLGLDETKKYFMYCGRLTRYKNVLNLINAFRKFQEVRLGSDYGLILVGGVDDSVVSKNDTWGSSRVLEGSHGDIIFTGRVSNVHLYYAVAEALVHPSLTEAFGRTVLEAFGHSLPVILSDVDALPEIAEGGGVIFFDPHDVDSIKSALLKFASLNKAQIQVYKNRSAERFKEFNLEKRTCLMLDLFQRAN